MAVVLWSLKNRSNLRETKQATVVRAVFWMPTAGPLGNNFSFPFPTPLTLLRRQVRSIAMGGKYACGMLRQDSSGVAQVVLKEWRLWNCTVPRTWTRVATLHVRLGEEELPHSGGAGQRWRLGQETLEPVEPGPRQKQSLEWSHGEEEESCLYMDPGQVKTRVESCLHHDSGWS